jgi:integrase
METRKKGPVARGFVFSRPAKGRRKRWYISFTGIGGTRIKTVAGDSKDEADAELKRRLDWVKAFHADTLAKDLVSQAVPPDRVGEILGHAFKTPEGHRPSGIGATADQVQEIRTRIALLRPRDTTLSIAELSKLWLKAAGGKRSLKDDEQRFTEIIRFFGADTPVALITAERVEAFRDALLEGGAEAVEGEDRRRRKDKLTPATVNRYLQTLRGAIRLAEKRHYQTARPFEGVSMLAEDNERNRLPTDEELERILEAAKGELRLLIILARWTAMRASEILGLEWKRVDLKNATVRLEASHTKGKRIRDVPLPAAAVEALKAWPRRIDTQNLFERNIATMSPAFGKLCASLGIEDLHLHDLRHFRLTELRRAGADLFVLQQISGHRTLEMLRRYSHVSLDEMRRAVDAAEKKAP